MAPAAQADTRCVEYRACHRARSWLRWHSWERASLRCSLCGTFSQRDGIMYALSSFIAGLIFGLGLLVSKMANPAKVLGFLDLAGAWDPSLAFVMVGAVAIGALAFALASPRKLSWLKTPMA